VPPPSRSDTTGFTLTVPGSIAGASVALTGGSVTVSGTGTVAATGTATLAAAGGTISDAGLVSATNAVLSAASISIAGTLVATATASLAATGAITETGVLNAALLTGSAGTTASFTGTNAIATLGAFNAPVSLTLVNAADLAIAGPVTSGGPVSVSTGVFALTLARLGSWPIPPPCRPAPSASAAP